MYAAVMLVFTKNYFIQITNKAKLTLYEFTNVIL